MPASTARKPAKVVADRTAKAPPQATRADRLQSDGIGGYHDVDDEM